MFEPKKGKCDSCNNVYDKEKYETDENPFCCGYVFQSCPNCGYNPSLRESIKDIISKGYEIKITSDKVRINSSELTDSVLKEILSSWPKSLRRQNA